MHCNIKNKHKSYDYCNNVFTLSWECKKCLREITYVSTYLLFILERHPHPKHFRPAWTPSRERSSARRSMPSSRRSPAPCSTPSSRRSRVTAPSTLPRGRSPPTWWTPSRGRRLPALTPSPRRSHFNFPPRFASFSFRHLKKESKKQWNYWT